MPVFYDKPKILKNFIKNKIHTLLIVPVTGKIPPVLMITVTINITKGIQPQIFKLTISGYLMYKRAKPANPANANDVIKCEMVNNILAGIFLTINDGNTT